MKKIRTVEEIAESLSQKYNEDASSLVKTVAKKGGKYLPLGAGVAFGVADAATRLQDKDYVGAGLAGLSTIAAMEPGVGTALAGGIDAFNYARDEATAAGGMRQLGNNIVKGSAKLGQEVSKQRQKAPFSFDPLQEKQELDEEGLISRGLKLFKRGKKEIPTTKPKIKIEPGETPAAAVARAKADADAVAKAKEAEDALKKSPNILNRAATAYGRSLLNDPVKTGAATLIGGTIGGGAIDLAKSKFTDEPSTLIKSTVQQLPGADKLGNIASTALDAVSSVAKTAKMAADAGEQAITGFMTGLKDPTPPRQPTEADLDPLKLKNRETPPRQPTEADLDPLKLKNRETPPSQTDAEIESQNRRNANPAIYKEAAETSTYTRAQLMAYAKQQAEKYGVPPELVLATFAAESGESVNPKLTSKAGAFGPAQLMADTAKSLGVRDIANPLQNIDGGVRLLKKYYDKYKGNVPHILSAYNAGEFATDSWLNGKSYKVKKIDPKTGQAVIKTYNAGKKINPNGAPWDETKKYQQQIIARLQKIPGALDKINIGNYIDSAKEKVSSSASNTVDSIISGTKTAAKKVIDLTIPSASATEVLPKNNTTTISSNLADKNKAGKNIIKTKTKADTTSVEPTVIEPTKPVKAYDDEINKIDLNKVLQKNYAPSKLSIVSPEVQDTVNTNVSTDTDDDKKLTYDRAYEKLTGTKVPTPAERATMRVPESINTQANPALDDILRLAGRKSYGK